MAARTNGERSPSRYDVRLVQVKPAKGRYRENLAESSEIFEQIAAEPTTPDLIVFPEAAMTGYFLEGAVYDLARPSAVFADDLVRAWRAGAGERGGTFWGKDRGSGTAARGAFAGRGPANGRPSPEF